MAEEQWYYSSEGRQLGPVTREMLRSLIVTAQLRGTDMVWTPGMTQWSAAQMVPQLMSAPLPGQEGLRGELSGSEGIAYAGFWRRLLAWMIDSIVLVVLSAIAALVVEWVMGGFSSTLTPEQLIRQPTFMAEGAVSVVIFLVQWLYYALMESSSNQGTLGKLVIGIYVTNDAGGEISFLAASVRFWAKMVSGLILGIGFLMAGFTERKQALHDLVAGTVVVRKR